MQNKLDKNIDKLVRKAITNIELDLPTTDFTMDLMDKIENLNTNKSIIFKPLISKSTWLFIGAAFLSLVFYVLFSDNLINNNLIDFSKYKSDLPTITIPKITISKTLTYILLPISLVVMIQGTLLKIILDNRNGL